ERAGMVRVDVPGANAELAGHCGLGHDGGLLVVQRPSAERDSCRAPRTWIVWSACSLKAYPESEQNRGRDQARQVPTDAGLIADRRTFRGRREGRPLASAALRHPEAR